MSHVRHLRNGSQPPGIRRLPMLKTMKKTKQYQTRIIGA